MPTPMKITKQGSILNNGSIRPEWMVALGILRLQRMSMYLSPISIPRICKATLNEAYSTNFFVFVFNV